MNTLKKHGAETLIHLLFWVLFIIISLFVFTPYYWTENPFLQYFFILVSIVYINNQILLPFFMKKKWYALYSFLFLSISFLATQLYCYVFARCGCSIIKCLSDYLWQTLTPLLFFSFIWMLFRYIDQSEKVAKIEQERAEMELKFLKSQINPHVLFNNLNTIYSYAIEKPDKAPDLILRLSDNLKHVLYESNAKKVSLIKEIQFIDNYIAFHKIRTEGIKQINYKTSTDNESYKIAPLLLITIIENAFKHSVINSTIDINIKATKNKLICICTNDYDDKSIKNTESIGLKNLKKRLNLLYQNNYELTISKTDSFSISLALNLK
ncbi:sensor histidine kinase [Tenacibaculum soleae]|uniref:sensor histidine kinase n=1 Tax=Tenacibaculum soleae TaxID=447689 RepID=UPI0026E34FD3|nr:histidine kinase [Tenacibaculum soleae]MDO6811634.1 histidine kinase [Tenacibaculum soleae]